MNKLKNISILDYPANILKGYKDETKNKLAHKAIEQKNYAALKHVIEYMTYPYSLMYKAIDNLDVEATKIITEACKQHSENDYTQNGEWVNEGILKYLFDNEDDIEIIDLSRTEVKNRQKEIFKILIETKPNDSITLKMLQKLVNILNQEDFTNLITTKNIDLDSDKFKDLKIPYKLNDLNLVLDLSTPAQDLLELLLSRSYTDKLSAEQIKSFYEDLAKTHPIAKEMLSLTAALIAQGNDIKILFAQESSSYYSSTHNIIRIDTNAINDKLFNIESILIHEIGHFIYDQIFHNNATPFDINPTKDFMQYINNKYKEYINDEFIYESGGSISHSTPGYKMNEDIDEITSIAKEKLMPLITAFKTYEKAARLPVDKAAELLQVNKEEYSKYLATQEYTEYFKHYTYIDLFFLNSIASFFNENDSQNTKQEIEDHVFHNIIKAYLIDPTHQTCNIPYGLETSKEEISKWAIEEFLPQLVKELNLTPEQIHFLGRIGDYINRGPHLLEENSLANGNDNEKYAELIVRAMELRAAHLPKDLTDSFAELELFHTQTISPVISQILNNSPETASLPFSIELNGNDSGINESNEL